MNIVQSVFHLLIHSMSNVIGCYIRDVVIRANYCTPKQSVMMSVSRGPNKFIPNMLTDVNRGWPQL